MRRTTWAFPIVFGMVFVLFHGVCHGFLDGTILSTSEAQSCATIIDSTGKANMQCDQATVMQVELSPNSEGGAIKFLFQNTAQSESVGGGRPKCDDQNPGTCIGTDPFYVEFLVSPIIVSYSIDLYGLEVPFG